MAMPRIPTIFTPFPPCAQEHHSWSTQCNAMAMAGMPTCFTPVSCMLFFPKSNGIAHNVDGLPQKLMVTMSIMLMKSPCPSACRP
eukprot:5837305-Lingulodinium_polyedra.AAC.1